MASNIFYTNNANYFEKGNKLFQLSGRVIQDCYTFSNYNIATYKKNNNTSECDNANIFMSGTLLYNNNKNEKALEDLYKDFSEENGLSQLKIFGSYLIVIMKNKKAYFIVEKYSKYKAYYYFDGKDFIVSTSFFVLAKIIEKKTINNTVLIENSFQFSSIDGETMINEVRQIPTHSIMIYNTETKEIEFLKISKSLISTKNVHEMQTEIIKVIKEQAKAINCNYKKTAVNMTGGLDSRFTLGALLSGNCKPSLLYGVGNSFLTNTFSQDYKIAKKFSKKYKLLLEKMDWNDKFCENDNYDQLILKYWEYFILYSANVSILDAYSQKYSNNFDFMDFGYFGETYRLIEWIDDMSNPINVDSLIEKYLYFNPYSFLVKPEKFILEFKDKMIQVLKDFDCENLIDGETAAKVIIQYRASADSFMLNFVNQFTDSFPVIGDSMILDFNNLINVDSKRNMKSMLTIMKMLKKDLLQVPIFSHCRPWRYSSKTSTLKQKKRFINIIINIPILKPIKKILKMILKKNIPTNTNNELVKKIDMLQKELRLNLIDARKYCGDVRALNGYYLNLKLIKCIYTSNVE